MLKTQSSTSVLSMNNVPIVRVSTGTAIVLGLSLGKIDAPPTTAYLMTYTDSRCRANCGFCPQARESHAGIDLLSRISWPPYETAKVVNALYIAVLKNTIKRVCIQSLNYEGVFNHVGTLTRLIRSETDAPVSVSCQPFESYDIEMLKAAGANRIGIPIDAATEPIFNRVKGKSAGGPYKWDDQFELLEKALRIMGSGAVGTHLIVGLGETEREMAESIQRCHDIGVLVGLFALTPVQGSALEKCPQPPVASYRRIQLARWIITHGLARVEDMEFDSQNCLEAFGIENDHLADLLSKGEPFRTSGCPDCNRPYYNERPSGPIYNYPRRLTTEDLANVKDQLGLE
jgi:biotin synthase